MIKAKGFAAQSAQSPLDEFHFERRSPKPDDVVMEILYCGVCHSDIHQARDEWGGSIFPMVPGHEIVGRVLEVGEAVTKFKVGDLAAVGCLVDSCRKCESCQEGLEQYCDVHSVGTYNSVEMDMKTPTYGGYSNNIVTSEAFVLRVPDNLDLPRVAPLLCAGITTYSPLRQWKVGKGDRVAVVGLGGLGHMGVKFAVAMGAEVTVISTSAHKEADARALGAHNFVVSKDKDAMKGVRNYFDFILNTVSASINLNLYLGLLRRDGTMVMVGVPPESLDLQMFNLIGKRRRLAGSLIGGLPETQEMLDYCGTHGIMSDIELIPIQQINEAYERMLKADVKYRFVIDMASL